MFIATLKKTGIQSHFQSQQDGLLEKCLIACCSSLTAASASVSERQDMHMLGNLGQHRASPIQRRSMVLDLESLTPLFHQGYGFLARLSTAMA